MPAFPVPVLATSDVDAWGAVQELRARPELRLVTTPRHASVLLVAGSIPPAHAEALDQVHDQLAHPRATVTWPDPAGTAADDVVAAVVEAHLALVADPATSEADRRPDQEPHAWRGVGPHGQGGEGMMGGTPYGRPMAMTGDDRDGLALDQLHLCIGPFLDPLPAGLVLDVTLQGDLLQAVTASRPPGGLVDEPDPVRWGLQVLAHALHVQGLDPLAARAAALAAGRGRGDDVGAGVARLVRRIRRSGLLWALRGEGAVEGRGDAADRWRARLAALEGGAGAPGGAPAPAVDELGQVLQGRTLDDAVITLLSLGPAPLPEGAHP